MKKHILILVFVVLMQILVAQEYTLEQAPTEDSPNIFWIKDSNDKVFKVSFYGIELQDDLMLHLTFLIIKFVLETEKGIKIEFVKKVKDVDYIIITNMDVSPPVVLNESLVEVEFYYKTK